MHSTQGAQHYRKIGPVDLLASFRVHNPEMRELCFGIEAGLGYPAEFPTVVGLRLVQVTLELDLRVGTDSAGYLFSQMDALGTRRLALYTDGRWNGRAGGFMLHYRTKTSADGQTAEWGGDGTKDSGAVAAIADGERHTVKLVLTTADAELWVDGKSLGRVRHTTPGEIDLCGVHADLHGSCRNRLGARGGPLLAAKLAPGEPAADHELRACFGRAAITMAAAGSDSTVAATTTPPPATTDDDAPARFEYTPYQRGGGCATQPACGGGAVAAARVVDWLDPVHLHQEAREPTPEWLPQARGVYPLFPPYAGAGKGLRLETAVAPGVAAGSFAVAFHAAQAAGTSGYLFCLSTADGRARSIGLFAGRTRLALYYTPAATGDPTPSTAPAPANQKRLRAVYFNASLADGAAHTVLLVISGGRAVLSIDSVAVNSPQPLEGGGIAPCDGDCALYVGRRAGKQHHRFTGTIAHAVLFETLADPEPALRYPL